MPLRPDFAQHRPNPRFDRYRDRVGRLFRSDREVGLVLVEVHPYAEVVGGWLWWRRWGPSRDALFLYTTVDGQFSDHVVQDAADDELSEYDAGRFWYYGEPLDVRWTGAEESAHLRRSWFAAGEWHNCRSVMTPLPGRCQPRASVAIAGSRAAEASGSG